MKKIMLSLLFSSLALNIIQTDASDRLASIRSNGVMFFGTEGTYAPYTFHDPNDQLVGFDVDIGRAIADKLGVTAQFIESRWDGLIAGLESKRYDAVINQVGITQERQDKYDFSIPYLNAKVVLITHHDNSCIKEFSDLQGKKSAQSLTSNYSQLAQKYGADIIPTEGFNQSIGLVLTGRADATLNDHLSFMDFKKKKPNAKVKVVASATINAPSGILLRKGQPELVEAINNALNDMKSDGTYKSISIRYFDQDVSESPNTSGV